jgi:hypothetical protein
MVTFSGQSSEWVVCRGFLECHHPRVGDGDQRQLPYGDQCLRIITPDRRATPGPITLVLDNARYQKCQLVWAVAETLQIELLYLPAYSPNLNLIERLWKFVKKQC